MNKLLSAIFVASFATVSAGAFAAAHGGAMTDKEKADKMAACKAMDPAKADDKMKAECKKLEEMPAKKMEEMPAKKMDQKPGY